MWSNMWSRKLYHSFAQLSTEVIGDNCEVEGEYATFGAVEPFWCSSSQTRRPTNWATPGNIKFRKAKKIREVVKYVVKHILATYFIVRTARNSHSERPFGGCRCQVVRTPSTLPKQAQYTWVVDFVGYYTSDWVKMQGEYAKNRVSKGGQRASSKGAMSVVKGGRRVSSGVAKE